MYFAGPQAGPIVAGSVTLPGGHPPIVGVPVRLGAFAPKNIGNFKIGGGLPFDIVGNILGVGTGSLLTGGAMATASIASFAATWYIPPLPIPYVTSFLKIVGFALGGVCAYGAASQFYAAAKQSALPPEAEQLKEKYEGFESTPILTNPTTGQTYETTAETIGNKIKVEIGTPVAEGSFSIIKAIPVVGTLQRYDKDPTPLKFYLRGVLRRTEEMSPLEEYIDVNTSTQATAAEPVILHQGVPTSFALMVPSPGFNGWNKYFNLDIEISKTKDFDETHRIANVGALHADLF